MGCPDVVVVPCPRCGRELHFQSKGGDCTLSSYSLAEAPDDVMGNVNRHAPYLCSCGASVVVIPNERRAVELKDSKPTPAVQPKEFELAAQILSDELGKETLIRLSELLEQDPQSLTAALKRILLERGHTSASRVRLSDSNFCAQCGSNGHFTDECTQPG